MSDKIIHISLDLETWGKRAGCDIRSIGAVVFDPITNNISDFKDGWPGAHSQFYIATENPKQSQMMGYYDQGEWWRYPLWRDPETVQWWNDQSPEAQAAFANPVDLWKACYEFRYWLWCRSKPTERFENWKPNGNVSIWSNGPHFDIAILEAVYHAVDLPVPWHYRAPRDYRTIVHDAAGMSRDDLKAFSTGTVHHALDDAISQAKVICEAFKRINRNG